MSSSATPELPGSHPPTARTDRTEDPAALAVLDETRRDFPAFQIWRETVGDRTVYVARRRQPGTRPHTLVTTDPHELHAILADTARHAPHPESAGVSLPTLPPDATR